MIHLYSNRHTSHENLEDELFSNRILREEMTQRVCWFKIASSCFWRIPFLLWSLHPTECPNFDTEGHERCYFYILWERGFPWDYLPWTLSKKRIFFFFNEILHFFIIVCILCIKKLGIRNFTGEKEQYFTIYLWLPSCQNIFRFLNTWFYFLQFIFEIRSRL